jgi:hypothetical protein
MPRSARACRAVGNARQGPSSVRWAAFAIVAAHISRADNVLRNDNLAQGDATEEPRYSSVVETISETSGFWSMFFLLVVVAIQIGTTVGFVWLVAHLATRKTTARTEARLQELEQRLARIEGSAPQESRPV